MTASFRLVMEQRRTGHIQEILGEHAPRQELLPIEDPVPILDVDLDIVTAVFTRQLDRENLVVFGKNIERRLGVHLSEGVDQAKGRVAAGLGDTTNTGADTRGQVVLGIVPGVLCLGQMSRGQLGVVKGGIDLTAFYRSNDVIQEDVEIGWGPFVRLEICHHLILAKIGFRGKREFAVLNK